MSVVMVMDGVFLVLYQTAVMILTAQEQRFVVMARVQKVSRVVVVALPERL
jgi:hypothetical protein